MIVGNGELDAGKAAPLLSLSKGPSTATATSTAWLTMIPDSRTFS
jgi:hypothetical protein